MFSIIMAPGVLFIIFSMISTSNGQDDSSQTIIQNSNSGISYFPEYCTTYTDTNNDCLGAWSVTGGSLKLTLLTKFDVGGTLRSPMVL